MCKTFRFLLSVFFCSCFFAPQIAQADVSVTVTPTPISVPVGTSQTFTASAIAVGCEAQKPTTTYQWSVDGSLISGATGSTYSYSSSATGLHTISCKAAIKDSSDDCGSGSGSATDTVVGIAKLQYMLNGTYTDLPASGLSDICKGDALAFKALPDPTGAAWPSGQPTWTNATDLGSGTAFGVCQTPGANSVSVSCGTSTKAVAIVVVDNPKFTVTNATASLGTPGTYRVVSQPANSLGYTSLENIAVDITACHDGQDWHAIMTTLTGSYSERERMTSSDVSLTEVTGPGGNTTAGNSCAQAADLLLLSRNAQVWYMLSAIVAHENVHGAHAQPALQAVASDIESRIEALSIPDTGQSKADAITAIKALAGWNAIVNNANGTGFAAWQNEWLKLIANDHGPGGVITTSGPNIGPAYAAEVSIITPMVNKIKTWRAAQKPPLTGCTATGD